VKVENQLPELIPFQLYVVGLGEMEGVQDEGPGIRIQINLDLENPLNFNRVWGCLLVFPYLL